jgi:hypothetical protein
MLKSMLAHSTRLPQFTQRAASSLGESTSPLLTKLHKLINSGDINYASAQLLATLFARAAPKQTLLDARRVLLQKLIPEKLDEAISLLSETAENGLNWTAKDTILVLEGLVNQDRLDDATTLMLDTLHLDEPVADKATVRAALHPLLLQHEFGKELVELETPFMDSSVELLVQQGNVSALERIFSKSEKAEDLAMLLIAHVNKGDVAAAIEKVKIFPEELQHTGMLNVILEAIHRKKLDNVDLVLDAFSTLDLDTDQHSLHYIIESVKLNRKNDGSLHFVAANTIFRAVELLDDDADFSAFEQIGHVMEATSITNPTLVDKIWKTLLVRGYHPDSNAYNHLLQSHLKNSDVDGAFHTLLVTLPNESIPPTIEQIGLVVLYLRQNSPHRVDAFLQEVDSVMGKDISSHVVDILSMLNGKKKE